MLALSGLYTENVLIKYAFYHISVNLDVQIRECDLLCDSPVDLYVACNLTVLGIRIKW